MNDEVNVSLDPSRNYDKCGVEIDGYGIYLIPPSLIDCSFGPNDEYAGNTSLKYISFQSMPNLVLPLATSAQM